MHPHSITYPGLCALDSSPSPSALSAVRVLLLTQAFQRLPHHSCELPTDQYLQHGSLLLQQPRSSPDTSPSGASNQTWLKLQLIVWLFSIPISVWHSRANCTRWQHVSLPGLLQLQHRARGLKALLTEFPLFTLLHFTATVTITVISRRTPLYITAGQSWIPSLLCSQSLSGFHCSRLTNLPSHCVSGSCLHWPSWGLHAPSQGLSTQPGPQWRASPLTVSFLPSAYLNFPWI